MWRVALTVAGVGLAAPARAELTVCNEAAENRSVAIAYHDGAGWVSEGWWSVAPGACKQVVDAPLSQRHYYYSLSGRADFAGEGYGFCVLTEPFTLHGADGDCAGLGAEQRGFAHVDTGTTEASFTLTLRDPGPPVIKAETEAALTFAPDVPEAVAEGDDPALNPDAYAEAFAPGTYGEPFTVEAVMQGCDAEGACSFYAEGARWVAVPGAGSNPSALSMMAGMAVNAPVRVIGDMISFGDVTAEAAVSRLEDTAPDAWAGYRDAMQGDWVAVDDPNARLHILGSEEEELYQGEVMMRSILNFSDRCADGVEIGPVVLKVPLGGDPGDLPCYALLQLGPDRMELSYVGRGNTLSYVRP